MKSRDNYCDNLFSLVPELKKIIAMDHPEDKYLRIDQWGKFRMVMVN